MMEIRLASASDVTVISKLAHEIWPITYSGILCAEQVSFMMEATYTISSLEKQLKNGHQFFVLELDQLVQGFASVSKQSEHTFKLEKLYIHPNIQQQGAGTLMIRAVEDYCRKRGASELLLNVNRNNKAKLFYDKMGYCVTEMVDIPYHQFTLNDFIMSKSLSADL